MVSRRLVPDIAAKTLQFRFREPDFDPDPREHNQSKGKQLNSNFLWFTSGLLGEPMEPLAPEKEFPKGRIRNGVPRL